MSRAYFVYFLMACILFGGLWVVITYGESIHAPDDLSGEWTVRWNTTPKGFSPKGPLHIAQSGRFFTLRFDGGPSLSLKLAPNWSGSHDGRMINMKLASKDWTVTCSGAIPLNAHRPDDLALELRGPGTSASANAWRGNAEPAISYSPTPPPGTANAR